MNRIVREHYPVEKLPENLREGLPADGFVCVTIEVVGPAEAKKPFDLQKTFDGFQPSFNSPEEVADHIRSIREEWD